jgi:hypothetical protein
VDVEDLRVGLATNFDIDDITTDTEYCQRASTQENDELSYLHWYKDATACFFVCSNAVLRRCVCARHNGDLVGLLDLESGNF